MTAHHNDPLDLLAATFIVQTLDIDVPANEFVPGLNRIERDDDTAVYAVQLESSVGPAAFLVYAYRAGPATNGRRTGQTHSRYDSDLQTLREAQSRNVPGPRLVATADLDQHSFILATDPQTFAALAGRSENGTLPVATADATADPADVRRDAAERLIPLLRETETQARRWLAAFDAQARAARDEAGAPTAFDDAETELALNIIGPGGIRHILTFANRVLELAQSAPEHDTSASAPPSASRSSHSANTKTGDDES